MEIVRELPGHSPDIERSELINLATTILTLWKQSTSKNPNPLFRKLFDLVEDEILDDYSLEELEAYNAGMKRLLEQVTFNNTPQL